MTKEEEEALTTMIFCKDCGHAMRSHRKEKALCCTYCPCKKFAP